MAEQIINIHNFHSKAKNKDYSILTISRPLTTQELNNGFIGELTFEEVFLPDNLVGSFGRADIGCVIERQYSVIGGKAYLENIVKKGGGK